MQNSPRSSRREFLMTSVAIGAAAATASSLRADHHHENRPSKRKEGARYMGGFAADPIKNPRIGFIGTGARGKGHVKRMLMMEGVEVVAICDLRPEMAKRSAQDCVEAGQPEPKLYHGKEDAYEQMLKDVPMDAVIISTPWRWHAPMGVATMKTGIHTFLEVPLAPTLEELWQLVDASETSGKHCMMMENVCYGREELMFLNMVLNGAIGKITHGEAAYIHDLRSFMSDIDESEGMWRVAHHVKRNGNLYPTHGLGPIAQMMGCERGTDRMERLVSFSSPAYGRALQAQRDFPPEHERNQQTYIAGDMNTSIVKTHVGRTILVQHDTTSPRPYTRLNLISGTQGTLAGFPTRVALDPSGDGVHEWTMGDDLAPIYEHWEHPLYTKVGEEAVKGGGHGGMDFIMFWRMVYCLRNGLPLDQNVYEGAAWSAVAPLSEDSVAAGGDAQLFPDFTRGEWNRTEPLQIVGAKT